MNGYINVNENKMCKDTRLDYKDTRVNYKDTHVNYKDTRVDYAINKIHKKYIRTYAIFDIIHDKIQHINEIEMLENVKIHKKSKFEQYVKFEYELEKKFNGLIRKTN